MLEVSLGSVRELIGAPLVVLLLLGPPEPLSRIWLERVSAYFDKPVDLSCQYLLEGGLAVYRAGCWRMAGDFKFWGDEMPRLSGNAIVHSARRKNYQGGENVDQES